MKNISSVAAMVSLILLGVTGLNASPGIQIASGVVSTNISGAGDSFGPAFSGDGRSLVFVSQANNLVTNDDLGLNLDVFVRDLVNSNTVLVSVSRTGVGGGNDNANYPSISSNGQAVAFASRASNLVAGDTNEAWDVFVRDTGAGATRLVSVDVTGTACAAGPPRTAKYPLESTCPIISADGRWVAFQSSATNLASVLDTNLAPDVFLRDLESNVTYLVSINGDGIGSGAGKSELAAMTPDGRYVAFTSTAVDIVPGTDPASAELVVRDMQNGTTTWVSRDLGQYVPRPTRSFGAVLSEHGRYIVFKAQGTTGSYYPDIHVLRYDFAFGTLDDLGNASREDTLPAMSADGQHVGFESGTNVYLAQWDDAGYTTRLVSTQYFSPEPANGLGAAPVLTPDGSKITFLFKSPNANSGLTTNVSDALYNLYVRDLVWNNNTLVTIRNDGSMARGEWTPKTPALSPNGNLVAFESVAEGLVAGDNNRASDVFVRNLTTGMTELASRRAESVAANSGTSFAWLGPNCISADGQTVVFSSLDSNYDPADTNACQDVWYRSFPSNTVKSLMYPLVVAPGDGGSAGHPSIYNFIPEMSAGAPFVSADGCTATYMTYGTGTNYGSRSVIRRDLLLETNNWNSTAIHAFDTSFTTLASPYIPSPISADSRFVLVQTQTQPPASVPYYDYSERGEDIFASDSSNGVRYLISLKGLYAGGMRTGNGASIFPVFSPNNRWVVFQSMATDLTTNRIPGGAPYPYSWKELFAIDLGTYLQGTSTTNPVPLILTNNFTRLLSRDVAGVGLSDNFTGTVFSANSRYVAFYGLSSRTIYRYDLLSGGANLVVCTNCLNPSMSADGQLIVYEQPRTNLVSDLYLKDMETGETYLVSMNRFGTGAGNGTSTGAQISHDGRYIVFASRASDLVETDDNRLSDVFVRDRRRGVTTLLSMNRQGTRSGNSGSCNPVLAADGRTVAFQSFASDLVEGDYNNTADIFVARLGGPDGDQDGMDDDWEVLYFGKLGRDGSADFDGDGMSDGHEFSAGTDPTNLGSVLRALIVAAADRNGATVHWPAVPGKRYQVQYKDDLNADGWSDLAEEVVATTFAGSIYDAGYADQRYYRVLLVQ